jgi:hypothetical protein
MRILIAAFACIGFCFAACGDDDNPGGVGNACVADADCDTDECYIGPGGGYCTTECENEGSTSECPVDTVCKPIQGGARRCLLICGSATSCGGADDCAPAFCPGGSSCVSISNSQFSACEPDPG